MIPFDDTVWTIRKSKLFKKILEVWRARKRETRSRIDESKIAHPVRRSSPLLEPLFLTERRPTRWHFLRKNTTKLCNDKTNRRWKMNTSEVRGREKWRRTIILVLRWAFFFDSHKLEEPSDEVDGSTSEISNPPFSNTSLRCGEAWAKQDGFINNWLDCAYQRKARSWQLFRRLVIVSVVHRFLVRLINTLSEQQWVDLPSTYPQPNATNALNDTILIERTWVGRRGENRHN